MGGMLAFQPTECGVTAQAQIGGLIWWFRVPTAFVLFTLTK